MTDSLRSWNLMHALSERILRANSATDELERWCRDHAIGDGKLVAQCARQARPEPLDDESLEAIYPYAGHGRSRFRKVHLATAGIVLADAFNWFFPENLTPAICRKLDTTDIPFGRAIRHLSPHRRTYLVRRCMPGQFMDADAARDPASTAFEHRAVVYDPDRVPLAVVHERFRATLVWRIIADAPKSTNLQPAHHAGALAPGLTARLFQRHPHDFDVVSSGSATAASR